MKRLVNTQLFCLLNKMDGTFNPNEQEFLSVYDDFVYTVTLLCTSREGNVPTFFTIQYARIELQRLLTSIDEEKLEKKSFVSTLHKI